MSQHAPSPVRYVTESQVQSLLSVEASICVNDAVFRAHAAGAVDQPLRIKLPVASHGITLFKPAYVGSTSLESSPPSTLPSCTTLPDSSSSPSSTASTLAPSLGIKVVSVRPGNAALSLPTVPAILLLLDPVTGMSRGVLEATYLTGLRTAAGSAVALRAMVDGTTQWAEHLKVDSVSSAPATCSNTSNDNRPLPLSTASPQPLRCMVVFGAGLQAKLHILTIMSLCHNNSNIQINEIIVINRTKEKGDELIKELKEIFSHAKALKTETTSTDPNNRTTDIHNGGNNKRDHGLITPSGVCVDKLDWLCRDIKLISLSSKTSETPVSTKGDTACTTASNKSTIDDNDTIIGVKQAVSRADVIVMATGSDTPLFNGEWLVNRSETKDDVTPSVDKPCASSISCEHDAFMNIVPRHVYICGVGSYTPTTRELDSLTMKNAITVIDSEDALSVGDIAIPQAEDEKGERNATNKDSVFIAGTLGEVLVNQQRIPEAIVKKYREGGSSNIRHPYIFVFKSVGTAMQDIATADYVLSLIS